MTEELRFDGRVALVTGAGNGLGRAHALLFASRGAKVVVNDLGGSATGAGQSSSAADKVVEEIRAAGGTAVASYASVEDGAQIVASALEHFGRLDIVVNNAGILRDVTFQKMTPEDWDLVYRVHVLGSFRVTHAAWNHLRDQGYGRIIMTASAAGIYGNFGQANYSMAKLGLAGLCNTLALEGQKRNIHVNTIAPLAGSRLTETILPKELTDALKPEYVSPLVAWLCHERCQENGGLFEVGGGFYAKLRFERSTGRSFRSGRTISVEAVASSMDAITSFASSTHPANIAESMQPVLTNIQAGPSRGANALIDADLAYGYAFPPLESSYDKRDLALYALAIGAAEDPTNARDLRHVYEFHGEGFVPFPTYAVVPALTAVMNLAKDGHQAPGMNYGIDRLLHGEQLTELLGPLPEQAKLTHRATIKDIFDKGKNALVVTEIISSDADGTPLIRNEFTALIRGAGGFGGDRGPSADVNVPPDRAPDAVAEERTHQNQALLYRLTGDWNPLHADPDFAKAVGFERPILHGLCSFGYASRAVLSHFAADARLMKSIKVRFAESVYPGETLVTEMWKDGPTRILFRTKVKERDKVVLSNAAIELFTEIPRPKPKVEAPPAPSAPQPKAPEGPSSEDVFIAIADHIRTTPEITKIGHVYFFKLTKPDGAYTVDLKNGGGKVELGAAQKADCTLELSDRDFVDMASGKLDPQKLYFEGRLKISGNVIASQKLEFLKKIDPKAAEAAVLKARAEGFSFAAGGTPAKKAVAPEVLSRLAARLKENPRLAAEVGARLDIVVKDPDFVIGLDLSAGPGSVSAARVPGAAATLTIADDDLAGWASGADTPASLFQKGKLRVDGDVKIAQRLGFFKGLL